MVVYQLLGPTYLGSGLLQISNNWRHHTRSLFAEPLDFCSLVFAYKSTTASNVYTITTKSVDGTFWAIEGKQPTNRQVNQSIILEHYNIRGSKYREEIVFKTKSWPRMFTKFSRDHWFVEKKNFGDTEKTHNFQYLGDSYFYVHLFMWGLQNFWNERDLHWSFAIPWAIILNLYRIHYSTL